jgi:hypothetical protein
MNDADFKQAMIELKDYLAKASIKSGALSGEDKAELDAMPESSTDDAIVIMGKKNVIR